MSFLYSSFYFVFVLFLRFSGSFSEYWVNHFGSLCFSLGIRIVSLNTLEYPLLVLFTNVPADWEDQVAVAATATVAAIPFVAAFQNVFLQEFRQDNFALIQEAKLRKRFQGENEDAASYYYDVLHMCHVINPAMTQTQILEHLYNGLRRSLLKKIYPLKPRTSAEFLEMVKIHTETSILLDRQSSDEQNASTSAAASVSMISQQQSNWKDNLDLEERLIELQKSLADLKKEYNSSITE